MPAAAKTPNIQLNQWLGNEYPKRLDFNEDNLAIDTAIKAVQDAQAAHSDETVSKVTLITEPYDQVTDTTVNLGFRPKNVNINACIMGTKYDSEGYIDASSQYSKHRQVSADTANIQDPAVIFYYDASNRLNGTVAITDTGLTIAWSLTGTLTGGTGSRRLIISAMTH